ncbi:hypothetical protein [Pseudomonas mandelii]|uniref:hypothetical protein n=1 Tax=Pseudomonas mandelii TaxID=75612 RepID=UPI00036DE546|nr:hypothetical protein [Pseudomonas mandelii]
MNKKFIQATEAIFDDAELDLIRDNVQAKGDAMDKALFDLALTGLRMQEILSCRLRTVSTAEDLKVIIPRYKYPYGQRICTLVVLPSSTRTWVGMRGIKEGGYLFPDSKDGNQPLSSTAVRKITNDWFRGVNPGHNRHSFANLRWSAIARAKKPKPNLT